MIEENNFSLEIGMLLVLRYRIMAIESYLSSSKLPETDDLTPSEHQFDGVLYRAQDLVVDDPSHFVHVWERVSPIHDRDLEQEALYEFEREATLLESIQHPAIPTIRDHFTTSDRAYFVTDYIDGKDLHSTIQSHNFDKDSVQQIVEWMIEICDVIGYLHEQDPPLIYRTLGADKVTIDKEGQLFLTDWGGVCTYTPNLRSTMTGVHGFAAPEQYRGEHLPKSDIYSIGALLHYLLTRHDPRQALPFSFVDRPVRRLNPKVSKALDMIVYKALAFDPRWRYQTVREMQDALAELL